MNWAGCGKHRWRHLTCRYCLALVCSYPARNRTQEDAIKGDKEMANQRMYIRCRACGAEKFIAKRLMDAFHTIANGMDRDEWDEFFEFHKWGFCDPEREKWGLDVFELSYEHHDLGRHFVSDGGA